MSIELTEGQIIAKTLQEIKDTLNGGITHRNMKSIRTFFVVSGQDSLDSDYPMYLPFNIPLTTQTVVSVYASFWLLPFRAYSKSAEANESTTTESSVLEIWGYPVDIFSHEGLWVVAYEAGGEDYMLLDWASTAAISLHTHEHEHTHDIDFGIYEENNSPSVTLFVSRDAGYTYPYEIGTYSANQYSLDITSFVDTPGSKMLKFESTALGRLSVQIEITLDVSR